MGFSGLQSSAARPTRPRASNCSPQTSTGLAPSRVVLENVREQLRCSDLVVLLSHSGQPQLFQAALSLQNWRSMWVPSFLLTHFQGKVCGCWHRRCSEGRDPALGAGREGFQRALEVFSSFEPSTLFAGTAGQGDNTCRVEMLMLSPCLPFPTANNSKTFWTL